MDKKDLNNTTGQANTFASSSSVAPPTKQTLPSLSGNFRKDDVHVIQKKEQIRIVNEKTQMNKIGQKSTEGDVSLYPYSEAGTDFDSYEIENHQDMVNRHEEISKEVEAVQGQHRAVNKELQKTTLNITERINSALQVHNKDAPSPGVNISGHVQSNVAPQKLTPQRNSSVWTNEAVQMHNKDVNSPGLNISGTNAAPLKRAPRQQSKGQSSKQLGPKTPRSNWTAAENEAFAKARSENKNITATQLKKNVPELKDRPIDSIKTKMKEHKCLPLSEAIHGGERWTSNQDKELKEAYKIHGKNYDKLMEAVNGRTRKAVYDRIQKYDKENKVGEQKGSKKVRSLKCQEKTKEKKVDKEKQQMGLETAEAEGSELVPGQKGTLADLMKDCLAAALKQSEENIIARSRDMVRDVVRKEFQSERFKFLISNYSIAEARGGGSTKEKGTQCNLGSEEVKED